MCLIFAALDAHPRYRLIVAANRDEFHSRETAQLASWVRPHEHCAEILAGRDLVGGGTWMGVTSTGRFSALTNYRGPNVGNENPPSRGRLVSGFLETETPVGPYCEALKVVGPDYNGFSLLAYDGDTLMCYSNRADKLTEVCSGVHGLSNHLLNSPWPKVTRGIRAIEDCLSEAPESDSLVETCFELLADSYVPEDDRLPDTGVGVERERALAPMFVLGEYYGTRSSAVVLIGYDGRVSAHERTFDESAREVDRVSIARNVAGIAA